MTTHTPQSQSLDAALAAELDTLRETGLFKDEHPLVSPQSGHVTVTEPGGNRDLLNLCANNYLGLADDSRLVAAAKHALDTHGLGMASVRFICGTHELHRRLEARLAALTGQKDAILFPSCFDANAGIFEALLGPEDAVFSDALNHASIIDGIRLCKAQRHRYPNGDIAALDAALTQAKDARRKLVVTDGVFSMDGVIADLPAIRAVCDRHGALLMVDDSHATGVLGPDGSGTAAHHDGVPVDMVSGTLGKALGGAAGGYIAGSASLVAWLRQKARPYLFSNALPPALAASALRALDIVAEEPERRARLTNHAARFREALTEAGFTLAGAGHPIIPVMIGDARTATQFAAKLHDDGIYAVAFSAPVVPPGLARIRTQMSSALSDADIDRAITAFVRAGRELGVIPA
ncbi:glycine C-acetyltransferase [Stakelama tenebrarum]|uniref:5-aminolevulinate synthase n=1 Tax=Stakelama tenebrarum TaxID=2711215 RepID=A0A6G6Y358_9SPHN|nr:glycine C-acetyltransferase [Sphingosinithalassobacter tenebrarum]QIG79362.1 glycine C-acetyltransferase [Sphingosinithalassobacter tenebrarum]